jgi:2Fe-2S ferredoxin
VCCVPWVTVEPSGIRIEVQEKEPVAAAAWRQGFAWPTKCWGQAACMSCFTKIVRGELAAEPVTQEESDAMRLRMAKRLRSPLVRLACRLHVKKDGLVLEKRGVRPARERNPPTTHISSDLVHKEFG